MIAVLVVVVAVVVAKSVGRPSTVVQKTEMAIHAWNAAVAVVAVVELLQRPRPLARLDHHSDQK